MNGRAHMSKTLLRKVSFKVLCYALLLILAAAMLYPLLLLVNISLKDYNEFLADPIGLTKSFRFANYADVWESMRVLPRTLTTLWMTALAVIINISVSVLAAFPLARGYFRGHGKVYTFVLVSMFFPGSLVATIILLKNILNVYGTPVALVIMWGTGSIQMNIFMLTNFLKTLPRDLDEAAFIDGCGYFRYIFVIATPLMLPIVSTLIMLKAIACWNDFLGPYIYVTGDQFKTLSTGLFTYMGQYQSEWQLYSAAVFIVALPMIVLYLFAQRFIIAGMVAGAVKG